MTAGQPVRTLPGRGYVDRYHYLGVAPLPEAQLRYLANQPKQQLLAVLGFRSLRFEGGTARSVRRLAASLLRPSHLAIS